MTSEAYTQNLFMSIGFMITYRCNIACPHCIVQAGPKRTERMEIEQAKTWISHAAGYRNGTVRCIALTGGEPFFEVDILRPLAAHAHSLGLRVSCVTNGFWATSVDAAVEMLRSVPGLDMVSLSTDLHHQRFIPLDNIKNGISALERLDIVYNIAVCHENENAPEFKDMMTRLENITSRDRIKFARSLPLGRMLHRDDLCDYTMVNKPSVGACVMASFPVIFPGGRLVSCIGPVITLTPPHPLVLGNLSNESLADILDRAQSNALLHAIRIWGPASLYQRILANREGQPSQNRFIKDSICDTCYKITTDPTLIKDLIALSDNKDFKLEVAYAREFYLHESEMAEQMGLFGEDIQAQSR
jgi:MoaA/NifB/PqqE/SkfB family radical SAM enzyme